MILQKLLLFVVTLSLVSGCGGGSSSGSSLNNDSAATTPSNRTPIAVAGNDQTVDLGTEVSINGSASTDADGDTLTFAWQISSSPADSSAVINNPSGSMTTITPDVVGEYRFTLQVSDGTATATDSVSITVELATTSEPENSAPVAIAGNDQVVSVGAVVTLDGSASSDADGDTLTYVWRLVNQPQGSTATLESAQSGAVTFTPDLAGEYNAELVVNDGELDSPADAVLITANNENLDITNVRFVNRSGSCDSYSGTYQSSVSDIQRSATFNGELTISSDSSECTLASNTIPNHDFNDAQASFATNTSEQQNSFSVPLNPTMAEQVTSLSLSTVNAILLNGVVLDLLAAACYDIGNEPLGREKIGCGNDQIDNPWRYDPMSSLNTFGTDSHNAHTQPDGTYHYHGNPVAMFVLSEDESCSDKTTASPVIGFAADGFPIYGTCVRDPDTNQVRDAKSSYVLKTGVRQTVSGYTTPQADQGTIASNTYDGQFIGDWEYQQGAGDLDECNGMTVDGQYGYYVVNEYPWVLKCFKGTPDPSFSKSGTMAIKMHSH